MGVDAPTREGCRHKSLTHVLSAEEEKEETESSKQAVKYQKTLVVKNGNPEGR